MKKAGLFILFAFITSVLASTCLSSIDNNLCLRITDIPDSSRIPIQIILRQPPFSYPDKNQSLDSLKHYSLMVLDSTSRYLVSLEPKIDSLFVKYTLLSVLTLQRISPPKVSYDYVLNVLSSVATINKLAQENLVARISLFSTQIPIPTSSMPGFVISATQFPFDTTLAVLRVELPYTIYPTSYNPDTIVIPRYGLQLLFERLPASTTCCPQPVRIDFSLTLSPYINPIRFPNDQTTLVTGGEYPHCTPPCTSFVSIDTSYKTHEYRFQIGTVTLFMKVLDGSMPGAIKVRFDTATFLMTPINTVRPSAAIGPKKINMVFDKNFVIVRGVDNGVVSLFDMAGKRLYSASFISNGTRIPLPKFSGGKIFIVKVTAGNNECSIKKIFMN